MAGHEGWVGGAEGSPGHLAWQEGHAPVRVPLAKGRLEEGPVYVLSLLLPPATVKGSCSLEKRESEGGRSCALPTRGSMWKGVQGGAPLPHDFGPSSHGPLRQEVLATSFQKRLGRREFVSCLKGGRQRLQERVRMVLGGGWSSAAIVIGPFSCHSPSCQPHGHGLAWSAQCAPHQLAHGPQLRAVASGCLPSPRQAVTPVGCPSLRGHEEWCLQSPHPVLSAEERSGWTSAGTDSAGGVH